MAAPNSDNASLNVESQASSRPLDSSGRDTSIDFQPLPPARQQAGIAARLQFMAGAGPPFIDAAGHGLADGAGQGGAAHGLVVCAEHAASAAVDFDGQRVGNAAPLRLQFAGREVNPKTGAAGAAGGAGIVGHLAGALFKPTGAASADRTCCSSPHPSRPSSRNSISAFCTCRRFSASSQTTDCGPSITSAATSSPRWAGRQCMKRASL